MCAFIPVVASAFEQPLDTKRHCNNYQPSLATPRALRMQVLPDANWAARTPPLRLHRPANKYRQIESLAWLRENYR